MVKNLTEGKPLPLLFFFALPMVLLLPHRVFVGGCGLGTVHGLQRGGVPAVWRGAYP